MRGWLAWLCLPVLLSMHSADHDFHISKGTVEYVASAQSIQVTLHVFIDDLELALESQGAPRLFLGSELEVAQANEYVERYLEKHFALSADGENIDLLYLGKETSDDLSALWIYLEARPVARPQHMEFRYDLLLELYDDQKNILNFRGPSGQKSTLLFAKGNTEESIVIGK